MPLNVNGNTITSNGAKYFNYKNIVTSGLIVVVDAHFIIMIQVVHIVKT